MAMASLKAAAAPSASFVQQQGWRKRTESMPLKMRIMVKLPLVFCSCSGVEIAGQKEECSGGSIQVKWGLFPFSNHVVVPLLAAALVGSYQPIVQATEWNSNVVLADSEVLNGDEAYKDLLKRIREKRGRAAQSSGTGAFSLSAPSPAAPASPSSSSSPATREVPREVPGFFGIGRQSAAESATNATLAEKEKKTPSVIAKQEPVIDTKVNSQAVVKQKTHGFLPLFLSQLLLLVGTIGGGYVLITTPKSVYDEAKKKVDGYVEKITPVLGDAWAKAQPAAIQAQQQAQKFAKQAQPYVNRAWEASKPIAAKAVEASKPILRDAKAKAVEFMEQAQDKAKK